MREFYIHRLWLVLLVVSRTAQNVSEGYTTSHNHATAKHTLLPRLLPTSFINLSTQQTILVHKSTDTRLDSANANTVRLQPSGFSNSRTFKSASRSENTRAQSVRNLYNSDTQITTVRNLFRSTRIHSADLQMIAATKTTAVVRTDRTSVEEKTKVRTYNSVSVNSVTFGVYKSSIKDMGDPQISQHATVPSNGYLRVKISSTISGGNSLVIQKTHTRPVIDNFQSKTTDFKSSYESFYTQISRVESSMLGLFLASTQTLQRSRIIEPTVSLQMNTHLTRCSFDNKGQSSTVKDLSKTVERSHITLTLVSSQLKPQESNSYLANTSEHLSSSASANVISRINPTGVRNITRTTANKKIVKSQSHSGRPEKTMENFSPSFSVKDISSTGSTLTSVSKNLSAILKASQSGYQSAGIESTNEVTDYNSAKVETEIHVLSSEEHLSSVTLTTSQKTSSGKVSGMPLYVLAICLPLAALLGFVLAFVFFKRNKQEQRVRYSVTVEITADKPDYELKRMYSIIDVTGGINKDFLSDLESRKGSKGVLDQLDGVSVSITQPDQTV